MQKGNSSKKTVKATASNKVSAPVTAIDKLLYLISTKKIQIFLLVAITFIFYGNSINNDFAFDDGEYYTSNQFVQKGFDGIYDLFTKESMYGFYGHASLVSGGRWRPLSLIVFALEKEFFDADPHTCHFINLLFLVVTCIIMLLFLRKYVFKQSPIAAFIIVLLFIIHPVHTEAVSHVKSLDELLSWLFLLLTMYCSLNFLTKKNYWQLILALIFYFLALISKENGISFIAILPLTFYFFTTQKLRVILFTTLSFIAVLGIYIFMRISIVPIMSKAGTDILNAPYLYATPVQHIATALMVLGRYILLLIWPNPLSCDYSYNQIPYVTFTDWRVWLSILSQAVLLIYALTQIKNKNLVAYGILFYFCSIFIVSNILIDVGTFIGERFLYQPSFGFSIAIAVAFNKLMEKISFKSITQKFSIISSLIVIVMVLCGFQTMTRNAEWNNDQQLWIDDVKKVPNSVLAHENVGNNYLKAATAALTPKESIDDMNKALNEFKTTIKILPTYSISWVNLGYTYSRLNNNDSAEKAFLQAIVVDSTFAPPYNNLGTIYFGKNQYPKAMTYFEKGIKIDSTYADAYGNLGACYQNTGQYEKAILFYKKALQLNPNLDIVKQNLTNIEKLLGPKK